MKSIKLRKVGLILAGAVFAMGMAFNFHSALLSTDQASGVSLENLMSVAISQAEEGGGSDCWTCTEVWEGFTKERDCCGQLSSCETCFLTGTGCEVSCQ